MTYEVEQNTNKWIICRSIKYVLKYLVLDKKYTDTHSKMT